MMQHLTNYQFVKLGSNLEFLRGLCSTSLLTPISGLENFPNLIENLPPHRYSVVRVVGVVKSLLIQLQEMKLKQSLLAAEPFRPMLKEMEDYLQQANANELSCLLNPFAERLVAISKQVFSAVKSELNRLPPSASETTSPDQPA